MASYSGLPESMLARSGQLLTSGDYAYELKWDGFRAIVSTEGTLRAQPAGWDMSEHVSFLAALPARGVFDGELVVLGALGKPDFLQLCDCVLLRRASAPLTFIAFDMLSIEGPRRHRPAVHETARDPRRPRAQRTPLANVRGVR